MDFSTIVKLQNRIWQVLQLTAILWNVLLLVVLCRLKSPRRSYFALVKSLTVADMLLPLVFYLLSLCVEHCRIWGIPVLNVLSKLNLVNRYSSCVILIHLICLAAEHYVAIMKPLRYEEWCRCRYVICRLVLCWTLPFFVILEETTKHDKQIFILPGLIVLSFLIMLVVYILIFREVRRQQRFENSQNHHARKNYRALMTTILNVVTFFLCWMPAAAIEIWSVIDVDIFKNLYMLLFSQAGVNIICVNSICDALIYSIRLTEVQKLWRKTFCCIGPCSRSSDNE